MEGMEIGEAADSMMVGVRKRSNIKSSWWGAFGELAGARGDGELHHKWSGGDSRCGRVEEGWRRMDESINVHECVSVCRTSECGCGTRVEGQVEDGRGREDGKEQFFFVGPVSAKRGVWERQRRGQPGAGCGWGV